MTILLPIFPSNSIIFGLTSLDLPLGRAFSSSQSSNYSNPVKYPGTCLVSSCLRLSHGKFEDEFDDFLQRFAKLLNVYYLVVYGSLSCIPIFICRGRQHHICIRPQLSRSSLSERPPNYSGIFCLYRFLPCTYRSLDHCIGSSGSSQ